jgi:hypothetical protein
MTNNLVISKTLDNVSSSKANNVLKHSILLVNSAELNVSRIQVTTNNLFT